MERLFYQFPSNIDRYMALVYELTKFIQDSKKLGLQYMIAVGAFEIGMESFLYDLAVKCSQQIYMNDERREFLATMEPDNISDSFVQNLHHLVVDNASAVIHILNVNEISNEVSLFHVMCLKIFVDRANLFGSFNLLVFDEIHQQVQLPSGNGNTSTCMSHGHSHTNDFRSTE